MLTYSSKGLITFGNMSHSPANVGFGSAADQANFLRLGDILNFDGHLTLSVFWDNVKISEIKTSSNLLTSQVVAEIAYVMGGTGIEDNSSTATLIKLKYGSTSGSGVLRIEGIFSGNMDCQAPIFLKMTAPGPVPDNNLDLKWSGSGRVSFIFEQDITFISE